MANPSYIQATDLGKRVWARKFYDNLETHGPVCGISPETIAACMADLRYYIWIMEEWYPAVLAMAKAATAYKTNLEKKTGQAELVFPILPVLANAPETRPQDLLARVFAVVNQIRNSPGYNHEVIGMALGIIPLPAGNSGHATPTFTIKTRRGTDHIIIELDFRKYRHVAVYIECRINGGAWEFLAIDDAKPYIDDRMLREANIPETREYRMRFWDQGHPNGEWSPIQIVSVTA